DQRPTPFPYTTLFRSTTNNHWAIRPAQHLSTTSTAYMAENCLTLIDGVALTNACTGAPPGSGGIHVFTITGTPPGSTTVTVITVPVNSMTCPGTADQHDNPASLR